MKNFMDFAGLKGRKGRAIAIIDSGVNKSHRCMSKDPVGGIHIHKSQQGIFQFDQDLEDENGHGTAIAGLIHTIHPQAPLYIVKLSSFDGVITEDMLVEAIRWCINNEEIGIVNISMGIKSRFYSEKLFTTCKDAYRTNMIIVAAVHSNPYRECYPAYFPFVLGVCSGFASNRTFRFVHWGKGINIIAGGSFQRVPWKKNGYRILSGTSLACARFTAALSKIIASNGRRLGKKDLKNLIAGKSNDLIMPLKYFHASISRSNGAMYMKNYKYAAQKLKDRKVVLYPSSDPDIAYLHRCWSDLSPCSLQLKDHAVNGKKQVSLVKRSPTTDLVVIGGEVADWSDEKIVSLHKLIKKALRQNADLLLLNSVALHMAAEYMRSTFNNYKGCIYTSVPRKRASLSGSQMVKPVAKRIVLLGMNIHSGMLVEAEKKIRAVLEVRGCIPNTITTDDYLYFLGADTLLADAVSFTSTSSINEKKYSPFLTEKPDPGSLTNYHILLINEKVQSHLHMNHQIQLKYLHKKLASFDPHNIMVVTDSDAEKDDLKGLLHLFSRTMPERTLFVGYWSNKRPNITRNFQLSITGYGKTLSVLNLDDNSNWQTISDIVT